MVYAATSQCGTIQVPRILGSLATDTLSGVGPAPLAAGTFLPIAQPENLQVVGEREPSTLPVQDVEGCFVLRVSGLGPRDDWFGAAGVEKLLNQQWLITSESNRVGVRLGVEGEGRTALELRWRTGELSSEGVALGLGYRSRRPGCRSCSSPTIQSPAVIR